MCGIRKLVADGGLDISKTNEPIPDPISGNHFSDQSMVRVPPEAHRKLAIQAAESGVSLHRSAGAKSSR
ncbi:toxin-antitoxin system HicB family antitoxin [Desulfatitalea alkaliphila]